MAGQAAADEAAARTSFIPLISIGIPENAVMALMMAAFIVKGIQPGPQCRVLCVAVLPVPAAGDATARTCRCAVRTAVSRVFGCADHAEDLVNPHCPDAGRHEDPGDPASSVDGAVPTARPASPPALRARPRVSIGAVLDAPVPIDTCGSPATQLPARLLIHAGADKEHADGGCVAHGLQWLTRRAQQLLRRRVPQRTSSVQVEDLLGQRFFDAEATGQLAEIPLPAGTYHITIHTGSLHRRYTVRLEGGVALHLHLRSGVATFSILAGVDGLASAPAAHSLLAAGSAQIAAVKVAANS